MVLDLSDSFRTEDGERDSLTDHFIENLQIRLLGCGVCESAPAAIGSFLLPAFLIVCYREGSAEIRHGRQTTVLEPGSFYLFRPYDVYCGKQIGRTPLRFAYLQFDIAPFMERYNFGAVAMPAADSVFRDTRFRQFGSMLAELAEGDPLRDGRAALLRLLVRHIAAQIVYDRTGRDDVSGLLKNGRESRLINRAFQYTAAHLQEPIVIRNILQDGATSKTSLDRAFRSALGTTPQRALLRFKIERSMEMLQQNQELKDIARGLGFSSVYHYSNTFKAVTGIRPTEYRRGAQPAAESRPDAAAKQVPGAAAPPDAGLRKRAPGGSRVRPAAGKPAGACFPGEDMVR